MYWKLKKIYFIPLGILFFFFVAPVTFAQTLNGVTTFWGVVNVAVNILNRTAAFLVGLAVFIIIWGVFLYIAKADDPAKRAEGMRFVAYGVLGVFIMISMWGFVNILQNTFVLQGRSNTSTPGGSSGGSDSGGYSNCYGSGGYPLPGQTGGCWE
jgi:uncharacterized membrane protein YgcG